MSHILRKVNLGNSALCEATIVNYATGGEAFTLAELGLVTGVVSVDFIAVIGQRPLGLALVGGNVVLYVNSNTSDPLTSPELPPTTGLNFTFLAVVHGT